MDYDFTDLVCVFLHIVWELADHGDEELTKGWNQLLDIFIPVTWLKNRLQEGFKQWVNICGSSNKQTVNLE